MTRTHAERDRWPGGDEPAAPEPHFASVVPGSLAQVAEQATEPVGEGEPDATEDLDEARAALDDVRARLAEVPAEIVVVNHTMGLYELAAIHLAATPPDLAAAALAIDSVACLVEGLGERLGPDVTVLRDALANIRLAFVQVKQAAVPLDEG